jgi:hypothetical protein
MLGAVGLVTAGGAGGLADVGATGPITIGGRGALDAPARARSSMGAVGVRDGGRGAVLGFGGTDTAPRPVCVGA